MTRILIASPVRQKPAILREFLWSLAHLEKTGLEVEYVFIDDAEEKTKELWEFAAGREKVTVWPARPTMAYRCDEVTHHWRPELIARVAEHKNRFLEKAKNEGFDFLFLVDSDLVLHPKTLVHLVGLQKDIVAEVFWTSGNRSCRPCPRYGWPDSTAYTTKNRARSSRRKR
ncbi:MAG: hypothetical protein ACUVRM_00280 [Bacillota bacterium]